MRILALALTQWVSSDTLFLPRRICTGYGGARVRIGVVSRRQTYWSTKAILKAIERSGHEPSYIKTDDIRLIVGEKDDALYHGKSLRSHDVVIPRIGRSMTEFGKMLLKQLELMDMRATLTSDGLTTARNKFLAIQALREADVPVPRSILLGSRPDLMETAQLVPYPAILKILSGTQGVGVMRVKGLDETASIVDTLKFFGEVVLLQEYIRNPGVDVRVFVVGDRVVGAMKRIAPQGEWRANIHLGAKGVPLKLDAHSKEVAIRAAKAVGLEVSGVDMIFNDTVPYVLEVNASPGFRGLLEATGINAANAIAEYAADKSR